MRRHGRKLRLILKTHVQERESFFLRDRHKDGKKIEIPIGDVHGDDTVLVAQMRDIPRDSLAGDEMHGDGVVVERIREDDVVTATLTFAKLLFEQNAAVAVTHLRLRAMRKIGELFALLVYTPGH